MLLTKVTLKNYGVFCDKNEFDFSCTQEKPIILCGGTNGAGKTTLFESIMLCLYGISFFEKRTTRKQYEKYLAMKIHRFLGTRASADHASIIVEFKFFHNGRVDNYYVERTWQNEDGKILEDLILRKNEKPLDSVEESEWQSFVEELIPRGIAKLFFFDGEKIVRIAEEGNEDIEIKSSFDTLLGLDLVEQLNTDLRIHAMRNIKGETKGIHEKFERLEKEKEETLSEINYFQGLVDQKNGQIDDLRKEITGLEAQISKLGGGYATKREQTIERQALTKVRLAAIEDKIRDFCAGPLSFCLLPNQLEEVKSNLKKDEEVLKQQFEKKILEQQFTELNSEIRSEKFWHDIPVDHTIKETISERLAENFSNKINKKHEENKGMFNFSVKEMSELFNLIDFVKTGILKQVEKESKEFNDTMEELNKIETILINAPKDDEVGPMVSKLNSLHSELGSFTTELNHLEIQIGSKRAFIKLINKKLRDILVETNKDKNASVQVKLAQRVQKVLDEYSEKLKIKKLKLLEEYLLDAISILIHKEDFIDKISIDKETFEIILYSKDGNKIPKDLLSKGEQQMFATAVLWALAKTSGKPLPFIIDTPLARLDIEHRQNLIEKFFPIASHQVIIFSTDSEIDYQNYKRLLPYISSSFAMEYLPGEGKTMKHDGQYFWNEKGEKIIAV